MAHINSPDMIWSRSGNISELVRVNPCLMCTFTEIGTGIDCHDSHLSHVFCNGFLIYCSSFTMQLSGDFPISIIGTVCKNLINPTFECDFFRRWRYWLIIQAAPIELEQLGLGTDRQLLLLPVDQCEALISL